MPKTPALLASSTRGRDENENSQVDSSGGVLVGQVDRFTR